MIFPSWLTNCLQHRAMQNAEHRYDLEGRAYYMTISLQRWLILRLDTFANFIILGIALFAAGFRNSVNPSKIGVVLSYSLSGEYTACLTVQTSYSDTIVVTQVFCMLIFSEFQKKTLLSHSPLFLSSVHLSIYTE